LEGDMLKASLADNPQKVAEKYGKLIGARLRLSQWEAERAGE